MVVVLRDHVAQGAAAHLLEDVVADAAAAPGNLFPHEQAEPVAELEHAARLLVVREADEVCAHVFDELHLLIEQVVGHGRSVAGVIFVAVGSRAIAALSVQLERSMVDEFGVANAEGLVARA